MDCFVVEGDEDEVGPFWHRGWGWGLICLGEKGLGELHFVGVLPDEVVIEGSCQWVVMDVGEYLMNWCWFDGMRTRMRHVKYSMLCRVMSPRET